MRSNSPMIGHLRALSQAVISGPQALAFLPALMLGAFWVGGEGWLLLTALGVPLVVVLFGNTSDPQAANGPRNDLGLEATLDQVLLQCDTHKHRTALIYLTVDSFGKLSTNHGFSAADQIESHLCHRLRSALRPQDRLFPQGAGRFAIILAPVINLDLESTIQTARRLQQTVEAPAPLGGATLYLTCSIGFVLDRQMTRPYSPPMLEAAQAALDEAMHNAPGAIRAYAPGMVARKHAKTEKLNDLIAALENGAIHPWFQPQISTDTGQITGVEALARWKQGNETVPPSDFLPLIEQHGLCEQLGDVILHRSLMALAAWDKDGLAVPHVGVNFSEAELRNPKLVDKIVWTLDRFDLAPSRLSVEILENVVATSPEDVVVTNIAKLAQLGCAVDLDDFGTGHASITALSRFRVNRLKIDRSFVTNVDQDKKQQQLVAAILSMAEQLGLDTLAEGVETAEEHTLLAQMGCRHVQGFGIARPMPPNETRNWLEQYQARDHPIPDFGPRFRHRTG